MDTATIYDTINTAIFLPWGGSRRIRRRFVEALDVHPGDQILELGCGTGQVTALLLAAGGDVVGVDRLPAMLARARQRAPRARLIEGDVCDTDLGGGYDHVVMAFVLHNLDTAARIDLLRRAAAATNDHGHLAILEWAIPTGRLRAKTWRRFLHRLEPSPEVDGILDGALETDSLDAGLRVVERRPLAGGHAQTLVVTKASSVATSHGTVAAR